MIHSSLLTKRNPDNQPEDQYKSATDSSRNVLRPERNVGVYYLPDVHSKMASRYRRKTSAHYLRLCSVFLVPVSSQGSPSTVVYPTSHSIHASLDARSLRHLPKEQGKYVQLRSYRLLVALFVRLNLTCVVSCRSERCRDDRTSTARTKNGPVFVHYTYSITSRNKH